MALNCGLRRLDVMAALAVIIAPTLADSDMRRIATKYQECSIMIFRRVPTAAHPSCPARHYCHGGQALCFPCSTCNESDCRRMTYEPQCTNADPFTYQMSLSKPQYTPACSVESLLRSSASVIGSKAAAVVKVESCDPGCDNLGINGSERCFSGTSCQLACGNNSVIAASWTALCNCSYLGNVATCNWIQTPYMCKPAGTQLPTAIPKARVSDRNLKSAARLNSVLDVVSASDDAGGTSTSGQLAGRGHDTAAQLRSLTKRTETVQGPANFQEWSTALLPLLGLSLTFVFLAVALIRQRGYMQIQNISNINNVVTNNCNYVVGVSDSAMTQELDGVE